MGAADLAGGRFVHLCLHPYRATILRASAPNSLPIRANDVADQPCGIRPLCQGRQGRWRQWQCNAAIYLAAVMGLRLIDRSTGTPTTAPGDALRPQPLIGLCRLAPVSSYLARVLLILLAHGAAKRRDRGACWLAREAGIEPATSRLTVCRSTD